jgi:hypothetical protein
MGYVSYTKLCQNLKRHLDSVCDNDRNSAEWRSRRHDISGWPSMKAWRRRSICFGIRPTRSVYCNLSPRRRRRSSPSMMLANEPPGERSGLGGLSLSAES